MERKKKTKKKRILCVFEQGKENYFKSETGNLVCFRPSEPARH